MKPKKPKSSPLAQAAADATPSVASSIPMSALAGTQFLAPPAAAEIREKFQTLLLNDLLGPAGGPDEELPFIEDRVRERYLLGLLAPRGQVTDPSTQDSNAVAGRDSEDGQADDRQSAAESMLPNSIGLSFAVATEAKSFVVNARWGFYSRVRSTYQTDPAGNERMVWKRTQMQGVSTPIALKESIIGPLSLVPEQPEVTVRGKIRKSSAGWIVTLFLVNGQEEPERLKDSAWLFQPELSVSSTDGSAIFTKRIPPVKLDQLDPATRQERESLAMLYRNHVEFAVGHGVSVHAQTAQTAPERATKLETRVVPQHEVPQQTAPSETDNPDLAGLTVDMKVLAEMSDTDLFSTLAVLAKAYSKWIDRQEQGGQDPSQRLQGHEVPAKRAIQQCRKTLSRIEAGIALLKSEPQAMQAFRFANRAMAMQRVRTILIRRVRKGTMKPNDDLAALDIPKNRSWRAFQLAFILLNLPSLTDLHHQERSHATDAVADLLWFPTGGGKTEAYLGLTAYTLALRRLQGDIEGRSGEDGVAVLMRYTLRLLTLQQFQRAATLICACEVMRREAPKTWGKTPFRIGLWVGRKTTPNTVAQSAEAIAQIRSGGYVSGAIGSPAQLTYCPWCGTPIDPGKDIEVHEGPSSLDRTLMFCGDLLGDCPFGRKNSPKEGLPVVVVDDEIYRNPPSLLIATVDKFAQMPWKGEVQMLFGIVNGYCPRHGFRSPEIEDAMSHPAANGLPPVKTVTCPPLRPPDLIIQDELHLISGPLGSMVSLYETAVDELCGWKVQGKTVRPKVVASTATIRRAAEQVKNLFLRDVQVFPPHGTEVSDNFFSIQRQPSSDYPGRRYLGLCAFGKRYPVALIRVYVAAMAAAQKLYQDYDSAVDPWMTAVGYFNSIRELAGTRRLVEDDIRSRLRDAHQRGLVRRDIRLGAVEELTSRKGGTDIPGILDRLELPFNQAQELAREAQRKSGQRINPPYPYDAVLATNMISVGVDVDRLGLMIVAGQPKTTAEYIQATSRVGRQHPGLVITLFNWARPRDLSHYESFEHYHDTFYQHVEALSVTPFAARALDRGLSGVLVALVRLAQERLNANDKAGELAGTDNELKSAIDAIIARAQSVTGSTEVVDEVKKLLIDRRGDWLKRVQRAKDHKLGYEDEGQGVVGLLKKPSSEQWDRFTCLNSLRDVEPTVQLILSEGRGLDPLASHTVNTPESPEA